MKTIPSSLHSLIKDQVIESSGSAMSLLETTVDSRDVTKDKIFIAYCGVKTDSHQFIKDVMTKGVGGVIFQDPKFTPKNDDIPWLRVKDSRAVWASFAAAWFEFPQNQLTIIGITGTNGKTSTCHYIAELIRSSNRKVGQIGTLGLSTDGKSFKETPHTSPDPPVFYQFLKSLVDKGVEYLVLEASSQGLLHGKFTGINFQASLYTSFSQDHLDLHKNMDDYWQAKLLLSKQTSGPIFKCQSIQNKIKNSISYGFAKESEHPISLHNKSTLGTTVSFEEHQNVALNELTNYGIENIVGSCLLVKSLGITLTNESLSKLGPPLGRMEKIQIKGKPTVMIDYAHTPDALQQAIENLNQVKTSELWVVFGCGGDRDSTKRPLMAEAAQSSDHMIITSDNPRTENPLTIIQEVSQNLKEDSFVSIENREEAIAHAIKNAKKEDIILIAGKGHEDYQIIGKEKRPFSDRKVACKYLKD